MENDNQVYEARYIEQKPVKAPSKWKGIFSNITAGVIGSVLTLTVVTQTGFIHVLDSNEQVRDVDIVQPESSQSQSLGITPTSTSTQASGSIADMVENASKAIVGIVNMQQQNSRFSRSVQSVESGTGSGVIFKKTDEHAYIVTNNHVIEGASEIEVSLHDGEKTTAQLVGADALTDLAVIKIDAQYATEIVQFGDSSTVRAGEQVLAIGNPLGLDFSRTVTQGIVSAVDRTIAVSTSAGDWDLNVIQTDAAINPGNSGGALINTQGEVIGINSLKISESGVEGLGFAIPSNDLVPIVNEMIETGKVQRPYMGVSLASIEEIPHMYLQELPESVTKGAMITSIDENSVAAKAGLNVQDVIVKMDDREITNTNELRKYLYNDLHIGDEVVIEYYSGGELKEVRMVLESSHAMD